MKDFLRLVVGLCMITLGASVARSASFPIAFRSQRSYDMSHPRNKEDVERVWPWRIDARDGIDKEEARIIAMHEVIERKLDEQCNLSSAHVTSGDNKEWIVAVPIKFSLTHPDKNVAYDVCVSKKTGRVTCFSSLDRSRHP